MKLLALLLAIILAFVATPSHALVLGGQSVAPILCPMGNSVADGCAGAAADGSFQAPTAFQNNDLFNASAATPTDYTAQNCTQQGVTVPCRPTWNVAGVDYPVGYEKSTVFVDPATLDHTVPGTGIPGCTFVSQTVNTWNGNTLTCGGTGFVATEIDGLDLGPTGGHDCTALDIAGVSGRSAALLIKNFRFINNSNKCSVNPTSNATEGIENTANYPVTFSQGEIDGGSQTFDNIFAPNFGSTVTGPINVVVSTASSPTVFQYTYMHDGIAALLHPGDGNGTDFTVQYSFIHGWCIRGPNCHTEMLSGGGGGAASLAAGTLNMTSQYNVLLHNWYENSFGPTVYWYQNTFSNPLPQTLLKISHTTQINSYTSKIQTQTTFSGCMGGVPTGGTSATPTCDTSSPSGILYQTAGTTGQSQQPTCGSQVVTLWKEIPGSYPIVNPPAPNIIDEWEMDNPNNPITVNSYYPNFHVAGIVCASVRAVPDPTGDSAVVAGKGANPLITAIIDHNWIDAGSQQFTPSLYSFVIDNGTSFANGTISNPGGTCSPSCLSSSTATLTLVAGESIVNPNCSSNLPTCPLVITGVTNAPAGTQIPISTAASIGPVTMIHQLMASCTNPVSYSGNVSMLPSAWTDTQMNQNSPPPANAAPSPGC